MHVTRRPIHAGFALLALGAIGIAGCGHRAARAKIPIAPARIGAIETGVASWYGIPYHGRQSASGEIYDMEKLTAAHRQLPFQTWVEVTNLTNGKRVDVRIIDRGPFAHGRIIDLSQAAARDIEMLGPGTARVRLRVIPPPSGETSEVAKAAIVSPTSSPTPVPNAPPVVAAVPVIPPAPVAPRAILPVTPIDWYVVQAGAFADHDRAEALRATLEEMYADARVVAGTRNLWRVVVGRQMTIDQAGELAARVRKEMGAALIVPEPEPNTPADPSLPTSIPQ
jgi:rare lipoprotein A